jgi:hypothetical protein
MGTRAGRKLRRYEFSLGGLLIGVQEPTTVVDEPMEDKDG